MKTLLLSTAICAAFPFSALADDILIRADVAEATVFSRGADVTRVGTARIPAGRHVLLVAAPDVDSAELPQITGDGAVRFGLPQPLYGHPVAEGALDDPEQAAARAAMDEAQDAAQAAQDALSEADAQLRSIETQQAYVAAILRGGESGVAMPEDPALVPEFLATLGAETARLADEHLAAQIARRDLADDVSDAQRALSDATRAFQALSPFGLQVNVFAIDVVAAEDSDVQIELGYFTPNASWSPSYALELDTETDVLELERYVTLQTFGAARWENVAVTFSTASPDRPRQPSELSAQPARLNPVDQVIFAGEAESSVMGGVAADARIGIAPAAAPVIMVEDFAVAADFQGLSVTYTYPEPVSVAANGSTLLDFDVVAFDVETENRAVPRFDETAFLVAMGANDSGAPILPGTAQFYRDGSLIGEGVLPLIAAGSDIELAFGPLDHLPLTWIDRSLAEGDRGLFVSSNTRAHEIAFGVENTSSEPEAVRMLYATPFAEQEDLELRLDLSTAPSERDVDDQRGVHAWTLEVAPGAEELIEMDVTFEFPEGQVLNWWP